MGRFASKERQILWKNVGCMSWIKLVMMHINNNGSKLLFFALLSSCV